MLALDPDELSVVLRRAPSLLMRDLKQVKEATGPVMRGYLCDSALEKAVAVGYPQVWSPSASSSFKSTTASPSYKQASF
jgi:hypothetical protein